jgi:outer membrane protein assembly factor BamB
MSQLRILKSITIISILILTTVIIASGCSGGKDPLGALGISDTGAASADFGFENSRNRTIWGGWVLDIFPYENKIDLVPMERDLEQHFNVTAFVKPPACSNCIQLSNFQFDISAGLIDLDATLVNPTVVGGFDVRAVVLLDEWNTGRKLDNAHGLTAFWSGDPYHPDPFINFARETEDRFFGPASQYTEHVSLSLPQPPPYNLSVPFIIDASFPDHPEEPVEFTNITVDGSMHPTGYDLTVSVDVLDWQDDVKSVFLDCKPLNATVGFAPFQKDIAGASGEGISTWTLNLKYKPGTWSSWLPTATGEIVVPIVARDSVSGTRLYDRITVDVTTDTDPPEWTGEAGIENVWWGGQKAIIAYYPATDPSGPVEYKIHATTNIGLIPPTVYTATGNSHYAIETVDGAEYEFIVTAKDSAGNVADNDIMMSGSTVAMTGLWYQTLGGDLESSPVAYDQNKDDTKDVIFGCSDGNIYSLRGTNGAVQWNYQTDGPIKSSPAIRDVTGEGVADVVIGSNDFNIYALNLVFETPIPVKTFATSNLVESSPVCADQTGDSQAEVIVGSYDNKLYAFLGDTGALAVNYDTGAPVKSTPAVEDFNDDTWLDIVVVSGGVVTIINGINAEVLWQYDFETGFSNGSPAIGDLNNDGTGDVVLGSEDTVYAFNVKDGELLWAASMDGNFDTSPALGDITGDGIPDVVISSRFQKVYVLDGDDGRLVWESDDTVYLPTPPALADMNDDGQLDVVVGSSDFMLRVINGADGYTLYEWETSPAGAVTTVPLITDVNDDGFVDVIFGTEGHEMWAVTTNHAYPENPDLIPWPKFMRTNANTGNLEDTL